MFLCVCVCVCSILLSWLIFFERMGSRTGICSLQEFFFFSCIIENCAFFGQKLFFMVQQTNSLCKWIPYVFRRSKKDFDQISLLIASHIAWVCMSVSKSKYPGPATQSKLNFTWTSSSVPFPFFNLEKIWHFEKGFSLCLELYDVHRLIHFGLEEKKKPLDCKATERTLKKKSTRNWPHFAIIS